MAHSTPAQKSPRVGSKLRLSTIALVSMFAAVLMVTVLTAATGDNIADAVLGQIDFSHNGMNNPNATSLNSPGQMAIDLSVSATASICTSSTPKTAASSDGTTPPASPMANRRTSKSASPILKPPFATAEASAPVAYACRAASPWTPSAISGSRTPSTVACSNTQRRSLKEKVGFAAILVFGQGGSFTQAGCATGASGLCYPQGIVLDSAENLYVADAGNNRVLWYDEGLGDETAQLVFGQGACGTDFTDNTCDNIDGNVSAVGMCNPLSVALDASKICTSATTATIACSNSISWRRERHRRTCLRPGFERNRFHRHHLL